MAMETVRTEWNSLTSKAYGLVIAVVLLSVTYQSLSIWLTLHSAMRHYTTHLLLVLLLVAVHHIYSASMRGLSPRRLAAHAAFAGTVALAAIYGCGYLYLNAEALEISQPFIAPADYVAGALVLAAILLLTWSVWGAVLSGIVVLAGLYFAYGSLLPAPFGSRAFEPFLIMSYLSGMGSPRGVFNYIPLSADTIFLLVAFGGVLHGTLVIDCFNELGRAIGRWLRGGVSYSAVLASTLIGMVTGQAVANIALSGSMTIPTMKRRGFTGEQAGAIECLASNGSQLVPPIMGLGAFLMAVLLGVDYMKIVAAAVFPAILYLSILVMGMFALIQASPNIPIVREKVDWSRIAWTLPSFIVSFGVLLVLLYMRYSGGFAGFWGIVLMITTSFLRPAPYRPNLRGLADGLVEGAMTAAKLALILAAIGVIVQMLTTTGLGVQLGRLMIETSRESLSIGLLLGMGISLFIGMGLPTPAAYALIAIVVVPSLIELGLEPIAAHFFGFYFAIYSSLTPPVAVAVLTAVRISGAGMMGTAWECLRLGAVSILLPFVFVAFPSVLGFPNLTVKTAVVFVLTLSSSYMLACAFYGAMRGCLGPVERLILLVGPATFIGYMFTESLWLAVLAPMILVGMSLYRRRVSSALSIQAA
jgi:TRAP transporter 4TM/12TM fusion protein